MPALPDAAAWQVFGQVASVIIFLAALAGTAWKLGAFRRASQTDSRGRPAERPTRSDVKEAIAETQRTQGTVAAFDGRVSELETDRADVTELRRRLDALDKGFADLRLHIAENYISREDWVPMTSRVIGMLEEHTSMLARLDERSRPAPGA